MSRGALTPVKRLKTDSHTEDMRLEDLTQLRLRRGNSNQRVCGSTRTKAVSAPRQSLDLSVLRNKLEGDLREVHVNHLLLKRLGGEKSNPHSDVYKCVDLENCQVMALKFTTIVASSTIS